MEKLIEKFAEIVESNHTNSYELSGTECAAEARKLAIEFEKYSNKFYYSSNLQLYATGGDVEYYTMEELFDKFINEVYGR